MSSLINPFSYADLPNDVGRLIFEHLAEDGVVACATVSKRVQSWCVRLSVQIFYFLIPAIRVERVIYREVALVTTEMGVLFHRTVQEIETSSSSTKPKGFLVSRVKSLFIKWEVPAALVAPILEACTSVTTLALYIPDTHANPHLWIVTTSDKLAPTSLAIPGSALPEANRDFLQPIFRNLTHLELLWEDEEELDMEWKTLRSLKHLTHLSVDMQFDSQGDTVLDIVEDLLGFCPKSVRVFIFWVVFSTYLEPRSEHFEGIMALHRGEVDPRVVVGHSPPSNGLTEARSIMFMSYADVIAGWGRPSKARETIWTRAEDRIERRMNDLANTS